MIERVHCEAIMWKLWEKLISVAGKRDLTAPPGREPSPTHSDSAAMLIRGGLQAQSDHPTLLFFTVHKAASSYVGDMLIRIARHHQIIPVNYMEYLFSGRHDDENPDARPILESVLPMTLSERPQLHPDLAVKKERELARLFPSRGFQFGPLRVPDLLEDLPHLEQYRTLIQLRDPRDCLVSIYFSRAFSHVVPDDPELKTSFLKQRRKAQEQAIDEYVLQDAPIWLENFQGYADALQKSPRLTIVKYEQMVLNFPAWLKEVEQAWGFEIEANLRTGLIDQANFNVAGEDIYSHKRQVLPGDHLRKLQPHTIRRLTDMFAPVLNALGYPLEAEYVRAA